MSADIYDVSDGDWRVVATDSDVRGEAKIRFEYRGEFFREVRYPAYKVWNIPAHLRDIVADFEHGMALASATGLEGFAR